MNAIGKSCSATVHAPGLFTAAVRDGVAHHRHPVIQALVSHGQRNTKATGKHNATSSLGLGRE